jgi:hypothetical protein
LRLQHSVVFFEAQTVNGFEMRLAVILHVAILMIDFVTLLSIAGPASSPFDWNLDFTIRTTLYAYGTGVVVTLEILEWLTLYVPAIFACHDS